MQFLQHNDDKLAYRDIGDGDPMVFVHGTPSSSAEYAELMDNLSPTMRTIAIDHLGFGASDKPPNGDYSMEAHTERLAALVDHLSIDSFHLVVHDFGGAIGLPLALDHPEKIKSITIMNSWAWPLVDTETQMKSQLWLFRSALMRWLYLRMNFSARVLVKAAWGKHRPLTKAKHRQYQAPFQSRDDRLGTVAFLNALVDSKLPCWQLESRLSELADKPIMIAWGMADQLVSEKTLARWCQIYPTARVAKFDQVGHFVADEGADLLFNELVSFLKTPALV